MGIVSLGKGEYVKAIEYFEKCIALSPYFWGVYNDLGLCYVNLKKYDIALEAFRKELNNNPHNVVALLNIGNVYLNLGEPIKALLHFKEALKFPKFANREKVEKLVIYLESEHSIPSKK